MTLQYPGERTFKALVHRIDHDARVLALLRLGPQRVYAGLLWWQQAKKYKPGWVGHAFRDLYGTWPRPRDRSDPAPPAAELEQWITTRPRTKKKGSP